MPQPGQIIPNYRVPHVMTVINDNTEFNDVVAPIDEGPKALHVFASPRGRDRVLLDMSSVSDFTAEFGRPNYKLFGQPQYNAYGWLASGVSKSYSMRVTPDDAAFANVIVLAHVKADDVAKTMQVYFTAVQEQDLFEASEFASVVEVKNATADVDGFVTYPLFGLHSLGRGSYGNGFRFRMSSAGQADRENDFKNFNIEVLEVDGQLLRHDIFTGTLAPEALIGRVSQYLVDRASDPETGSTHVGLYVAEESIIDIFNKYKELNPDTELTLDTFDFVAGKSKAGVAIPNYAISTGKPNQVSLDTAEGIPFGGGVDGSFDAAIEAGAREAALDLAYTKAFAGEFDRRILSKFRAPMDTILDAGYSAEVKTALIQLITKRGDAFGHIDAGIVNSLTDLKLWAEEMHEIGNRLYGKEGQHYKIRDPFTGRPIEVTTTYWLSQRLPGHIQSVGSHVPLVGEQRATLTGAIPGSLKPVVDVDDLENKEVLYNFNVNTFHQLSARVAVRSTQETAQPISSDLSEENNMRTLLEVKRELENYASSLTYNFAEEGDRALFTANAKERLSSFVSSGAVRSADVAFEMTPFEEERSILHCYAAVVFKTMAKRHIVEIDVNRRV